MWALCEVLSCKLRRGRASCSEITTVGEEMRLFARYYYFCWGGGGVLCNKSTTVGEEVSRFVIYNYCGSEGRLRVEQRPFVRLNYYRGGGRASSCVVKLLLCV